MMKKITLIFALLVIQLCFVKVLLLREQFKIVDGILKDRFDNLVPQLIDVSNINMWYYQEGVSFNRNVCIILEELGFGYKNTRQEAIINVKVN